MPRINLDLLPENERELAKQFTALNDLLHWVREFQSSRGLFEYCSVSITDFTNANDEGTASLFKGWRIAAARDCSMSVYHFGRVIQGMNETLGPCTSLRALIKSDVFREASKRYSANFPWFIELRNAIAHSAETRNTPRASAKHSAKGPNTLKWGRTEIEVPAGQTLQLMSELSGTLFSSMWEGKIYSCDISEATAFELEIIQRLFWDAFSPTTYEEAPPKVSYSDKPTPGALRLRRI